jgi:hypothetical protein
MERLHFRSTSLLDLQAELHQRELLREASASRRVPRPNPTVRKALFGLSIFGRRFPI